MRLCKLCLEETKGKRQTQMIEIGPVGGFWWCRICDGLRRP